MTTRASRGADSERTDLPSEQGGLRGLVTRSTDGEPIAGAIEVRQLRVVFGHDLVAARTIPLTGAEVHIGREEAPATFVVAASEVSRRHASLAPDADGAWMITDAGSRNGVFVDGVPIAGPVAVHHGTVIRIGPVVLVCEDTIMAPAGGSTAVKQPTGTSMAIRRLRAELGLVASSLVPVLIEGETGVGKEVAASAIHGASGRSGPFIAVNCAAIPTELAESELFGHAGGAYTNAGKAKVGLVVAASGGTLFLDELGELPLEVQAKLLRVLATGEVRPLGSCSVATVDVRVIAATNRDLDAEVAAGRFRADLLARVAAWRVSIPPLRARREDVLSLTETFLARERVPARLTAHAAEALVLHAWPYNVRELEQTVRQIAVRAAGTGVVRIEHLPAELSARVGGRGQAQAGAALPLAVLVDRTVAPSRDVLLQVLEHFAGSVAQTARFFGRDRKQIYRWADRLAVALAPESGG